MEGPLRATRAEINLRNLRHNIISIRRYIADETEIMAVVKADGYGHGASEVASIALKYGAAWLGVAFVEEGVKLRQDGFNVPILVLNPPFSNQAELFFKHNLIPTIFTCGTAKTFSDIAVKKKCIKDFHLKVDTGMGRVGIYPHTKVDSFLKAIRKLPGLNCSGLYTHFATAGDNDKYYAQKQLSRFLELVSHLKLNKICPPVVHAANSAAILEMPEAWIDMVRLGISMYGHYPSSGMDKSNVLLKPLMTLKSRVSFIKNVPAGTPISYGCTYITNRKSRVATIPLGYGDGYSRLLSNKANVLIRGKRHPVIGNICMDQFMVDVSGDSKVRAGDEVVLFGEQGDKLISVEEVASLQGTINYEILCAIGKRVPRFYIL